MSIVISTPTGNIGSRALQQLLKAGAKVSVIVRNPDKLAPEIRGQIEIHQGSLLDSELVSKAFRGAEAVLWVTPTDYSQEDVIGYTRQFGTIAANAIRENKVPHVVSISSTGAQLENAGPITGVGLVEKLLDEAAPNTLHLRAGFFMENFLHGLAGMKNEGAIYYPFPADTKYPMVATQDIGDVAAEALLHRSWKGRNIRGVHGPADVSFAEAAQILGEAIGRPVRHIQITPEQAYEAFHGAGLSKGFAAAYVQMYQALQQPGAVAEKRTAETTTPTTLKEWSERTLRG